MRGRPWFGVLVAGLVACPDSSVPVGSGAGSDTATDAGSTRGPGATSTQPAVTSTGESTTGPSTTGVTTGSNSTGTGTTAEMEDSSEAVDGLTCFHSQPCGDGSPCGAEQCDCGQDPCMPEQLGFAQCEDLTNPLFPERVYTGGVLGCNPASCRYDFNQCTFCGDTIVNGNETCEPDPPPTDTCASLGLGDATDPLPCDLTCQIDTSSCA